MSFVGFNLSLQSFCACCPEFEPEVEQTDIMSLIEAFKQMGAEFPMNPPEEGWDGTADIKTFPDGSRWAICPHCGKKAVKILPETRIHNMPWKCKASDCKKEFVVNVGRALLT